MSRLDTIRAMLESGEHSLQSVGRCVGCSRQEVHRLAQKHGITARGGVAMRAATRAKGKPVQDILATYQTGASLERTGAQFGVSRHIVTRLLADTDTPKRAYSERASRNYRQTDNWRSEDAAYPYLSDDRTDPTGLLSMVNGLVPSHIPHFIRADVCQDVVLAILEGRIAPGGLRDAVPAALKRVRKMHPAFFGPLSLDSIIPGTDGLRLIETIASDREHF